jgi:hypothetical protein
MRAPDLNHLSSPATMDVRGSGSAANFSRLRCANLHRFTTDRLMSILRRLDQEVEISADAHPRRAAVSFSHLTS